MNIGDIIARQGTSLRQYFGGRGYSLEWLDHGGDAGVYVDQYLKRTGGDMANAIAYALTDNRSARRIILPSGEYTMSRGLGDGLGGDGLRSDLHIEGHNTKLVSTGAASFGWFYFPQPSARVSISGIHFYRNNPPLFHAAIVGYENTDWRVWDCTFEAQGQAPEGDLLRCALVLIGGVDSVIWGCKFIHAQGGFAGYGYGSNGCAFIGNVGEEVSDFLWSAVASHGKNLRNQIVAHNRCRASNGSGVFYYGDDGIESAGDTSDIVISDNTITDVSVNAPYSPKRYIIMRTGLSSKRVKICNNVMTAEGTTGPSIIGISVFPGQFSNPITELTILDNDIGPLGSNAGAGIEVYKATDSIISRNTMRGNRGLYFQDLVDCDVDFNRVRGATSHACYVETAFRASTGLRFRGNMLESTAAGCNGMRFVLAGGFGAAARVSDCRIVGGSGATSVGYARAGSETATVDLHYSQVPGGVASVAGFTTDNVGHNEGYP